MLVRTFVWRVCHLVYSISCAAANDPIRKVLENFVKKNVELTQVLSKLEAVVKNLTEENKTQQRQLQKVASNHKVKSSPFKLTMKVIMEENNLLQERVAALEKENAELRMAMVEGKDRDDYQEKIAELNECNQVLQTQVDQMEKEKSAMTKKVDPSFNAVS